MTHRPPLIRRQASEEVLVGPPVEVGGGELEVVAGGGAEGKLTTLVEGLQPEGVLLVVLGITHLHHLSVRALREVAPPLSLVGEHHVVTERLHSVHLLGAEEVRLEGRVEGSRTLAVPLRELRALLVGLRAGALRGTEVVRLEEVLLHDRAVRQFAERRRQGAADGAAGNVALGECANTHEGAVHAHEALHGGVVVLLHVSAAQRVALRETDAVETVGELRVVADAGGKAVDAGVHVEEEAVDSVPDETLTGRDALGVAPRVLGQQLRDTAGAEGVEARVPHTVAHNDRQLAGVPRRLRVRVRKGGHNLGDGACAQHLRKLLLGKVDQVLQLLGERLREGHAERGSQQRAAHHCAQG
eukprot:Hpha_TRINITY_DN16742_c0_g3::TRINITY_DN16742_c0_g3_i8::g.80480::m.80480